LIAELDECQAEYHYRERIVPAGLSIYIQYCHIAARGVYDVFSSTEVHKLLSQRRYGGDRHLRHAGMTSRALEHSSQLLGLPSQLRYRGTGGYSVC